MANRSCTGRAGAVFGPGGHDYERISFFKSRDAGSGSGIVEKRGKSLE